MYCKTVHFRDSIRHCRTSDEYRFSIETEALSALLVDLNVDSVELANLTSLWHRPSPTPPPMAV